MPGTEAPQLGIAAVLTAALPSPSLKGLADLVAKHMPVTVLHEVEVDAGCLNNEYSAMELLYHPTRTNNFFTRTSRRKGCTTRRRCAFCVRLRNVLTGDCVFSGMHV